MTQHYQSTLAAAFQRRQDATARIVGAFQAAGIGEEPLRAARAIREEAQHTLEGQTRPALIRAASANADTILHRLFDFAGQGFDAEYNRRGADAWARTITSEDDATAETNRLLRFGEHTVNLQRAGALARRALVEGIWPGLLTSWVTGPLGGARGGHAAVQGYRTLARIIEHPESHPALADLETAEQVGVRIGVLPRSVLLEADDPDEAEGNGTAAA